MAGTFQRFILTPEKMVFEGPVEFVEAPGSEGCFGVLANHAAMVTGLASGTLKVRDAAGGQQSWQVSAGFFEVSHNKEVSHNTATVLVDSVSG